MHYATKYKRRIAALEKLAFNYYDAIYDAKLAIQNRNGLKATPVYDGRSRIESSEERMPIKDFEGACKLIENLPLIPPH